MGDELSANSTEQGNVAFSGTDLVDHLPAADRSKPAALDLDMVAKTRAAGIGAMIPFTLNDYVASKDHESMSFAEKWTPAGGQRDLWFDRNHPVTTGAIPAEPRLDDGAVYADQHFAYLKAKLGDIYAAGATRVIVGTDNEPDTYHENYPFLQAGAGAAINRNGVGVGTLVDGLSSRGPGSSLREAREGARPERVRRRSGPLPLLRLHDLGGDDEAGLLRQRRREVAHRRFSRGGEDRERERREATHRRLGLPLVRAGRGRWSAHRVCRCERVDGGADLNSPRGFWDDAYDENAWYTDGDHTNGPAMILRRAQDHLAAHYAGTPVGVSEYWPGGCNTIYSGLGVVDTLGIFQRMNVALGAMWPDCEGPASELRYAYGAFRLVRNADGNGLKFASRFVPVTNPATAAVEKAERALSSVYAGSDGKESITALIVNKKDTSRRFALRAWHSAPLRTVDIYRIYAASPNPVLVRTDTLTKRNAYLHAAPAFSATLLVFEN